MSTMKDKKMTKDEKLANILTDWRLIILLLLIGGSIIAIGPHFDENRNLTTNIKFGLDLAGGAVVELLPDATTVDITSVNEKTKESFLSNLAMNLGIDPSDLMLTDSRLEIHKIVDQRNLEDAITRSGGRLTKYYGQGIPLETFNKVKEKCDKKLSEGGKKSPKITITSDSNKIGRSLRIELAELSLTDIDNKVSEQGKFEMKIGEGKGKSKHVLYGDKIRNVGSATPSFKKEGMWETPFELTREGDTALLKAINETIPNPDTTFLKDAPHSDYDKLLKEISQKSFINITDFDKKLINLIDVLSKYPLIMELDGKKIFSGSMAPDLYHVLKEDEGKRGRLTALSADEEEAKKLEMHIRHGSLPVKLLKIGSANISAPMGEQNKKISILAGLLALLAVAFVVFHRYRRPWIVIPMVLINSSEILILLGLIVIMGFELDLPTIAGLIAVIGTGIDQMVVITDEIFHGGETESRTVYLQRLGRALGIIIAAAATVFVAMIPIAVMDLGTLNGFAIVTILGVLVGVIVTRPVYGSIVMKVLSDK